MRLRSSTVLISLGLAFLTLGLVLMAHSLGIDSGDVQSLVRARVQASELVAAQCSSAATADDVNTMSAIIAQVAARNPDVISAGLRNLEGKLLYKYGPHGKTWDSTDRSPSSQTMKLRVPVAGKSGDWGAVEFCFRRSGGMTLSYLPRFLVAMLSNPALRMAFFVASAGFVCYLLYLRRTLLHLDPSSVIPPRVRAMLDALAEGVVVLDRAGRIVLANEAFGRMTGMPQQTLQGHRADRLEWVQPSADEPVGALPWNSALASGHAERGVALGLRVPTPQDEDSPPNEGQPACNRRILMVNAAPILGPDARVRGALATFDDVTEIERMNLLLQESRDEVQRRNVELRRLAITDPLTGCLNRRAFMEQCEDLWSSVSAGIITLGCVMIDVDKFKSINDRFGHAAGDDVLKSVAAILLTTVGERDLVCRYGGEEFCVLLPGKDVAAAADVADQIRQAIESAQWPVTKVAVSLGVASSEQAAPDIKTLLDRADQALYASKCAGRNRVTRWGERKAESRAIAGETFPEILNGVVTPAILREHNCQAAFLAMVAALAHRSAETATHSRRVADLCMLAAPGLLSADEAAPLEAAALLHDVGKIGVPDAILLKPGPLNEQDWEIVRARDHVGVDLIAAAGVPSQIVWIVAAHHARYAGPAGGTDRPTGQDIPVAARLLAVADAFDAMTHDRPYQKRMSVDDAIAELRRCAGTQFDPNIVEHFVNMVLRSPNVMELLPREAA